MSTSTSLTLDLEEIVRQLEKTLMRLVKSTLATLEVPQEGVAVLQATVAVLDLSSTQSTAVSTAVDTRKNSESKQPE